MARGPINRDVANDVISESLGLSADDLGMDREDPFKGMNFNEETGEREADDEIEDDNDELDAGDDDTTPRRRGEEEDDEGDGEGAQLEQPQPKPQRREKEPKQDDLSVSHTPDQPQKTFKRDKNGNILGQDGKSIIAKAGREARYFQGMHQARDRLATVQQAATGEIKRLDTNLRRAVEIGTGLANQLQSMREAGTAHTRMGISDAEHQEALQFAVQWKQNPLEFIKTALTRAATRGIDMTALGLQPGGFDPKSLLDMVRAEIGKVAQPIQQRNEQETAQQRQQREAEERQNTAATELSSFLVANPDAKKYLPVFEKIYADPQYANMSLNEVWLRIQLNLANLQRQSNGNGQRLRNRQQPRLPNGRNSPPDGGRERERFDVNEPAPVSQSYEDIVRSVLPR